MLINWACELKGQFNRLSKVCAQDNGANYPRGAN